MNLCHIFASLKLLGRTKASLALPDSPPLEVSHGNTICAAATKQVDILIKYLIWFIANPISGIQIVTSAVFTT